MTAKVTFSPDGTIHRIVLGKLVVGSYPPVTKDKLYIHTVDMRDLEKLITILDDL